MTGYDDLNNPGSGEGGHMLWKCQACIAVSLSPQYEVSPGKRVSFLTPSAFLEHLSTLSNKMLSLLVPG